jgi:hypothetical protein
MSGSGTTSRADPALIGIYLNDHLAGATGGLELVRRTAGATKGTALGRAVAVLAGEIADDRKSLLDLMRALDVPVRAYKVAIGWFGEKAGRLKLNGRVLSRSPLSTLVELELLRIGVEGKTHGWQVLRLLADVDDRLDAAQLDELIARARRQADRLTSLHADAAEALTRP